YSSIRVLASPAVERLNLDLQRRSKEEFHTRLKRLYEVRLDDDAGRTETRHVLAKSVGWGWLGYHAVLAGEPLRGFVPPLLVRHGIAHRAGPFAVLIDGKMRAQEWITGPGSLLKTDFEHHGQGKNALNVTDPAYDLAEAILSLGLSEPEERWLISRYIEQSGD